MHIGFEKGIGNDIQDENNVLCYVSAYARFQGTIRINRQKTSFRIAVTDMAFAFSLIELIKKIMGDDVQLTLNNTILDKTHKIDGYYIEIEHPSSFQFLQKIGILTYENKQVTSWSLDIPPFVCDSTENLAYYLRGLIDARGKIYFPDFNKDEKDYRIEISPIETDLAESIIKRLDELDIKFKVSERKETGIMYSTDSTAIHDILAFIKRSEIALKLDEIVIQREVSAEANKQRNCDMGNIKRSVTANEKLKNAIDVLKNRKEYDSLDEEIKKTANLKLQYGMTLNEIATELNVSKSCVNHRLRKILALAENN